MLVATALAALVVSGSMPGSSRPAGATPPVVAPRPAVAKLVAQAHKALGTTFNATYRTTTKCGRRTCTGTAEVWQRSLDRFAWRYGGGAREVVFAEKGPYACQYNQHTGRWGCLRVMGMGPSMLASLYPPALLEGDLATLSLGPLAPADLTFRAVDGRPSRCLLFGPVRLPMATVCVGSGGLVTYLSTSVEVDDSFDGTVEMTSFSRTVPPAVFELPGPISNDG
jgi:hypothetical protein